MVGLVVGFFVWCGGVCVCVLFFFLLCSIVWLVWGFLVCVLVVLLFLLWWGGLSWVFFVCLVLFQLQVRDTGEAFQRTFSSWYIYNKYTVSFLEPNYGPLWST